MHNKFKSEQHFAVTSAKWEAIFQVRLKLVRCDDRPGHEYRLLCLSCSNKHINAALIK